MYDEQGEKTWDCTLDVYGKVANFEGSSLKECPFWYQGQYEDKEAGLYYNRFRYYSAEEGMYICQDPIGLAGNNPTLYAYVNGPNTWLDPFGLLTYNTMPAIPDYQKHHVIPQQLKNHPVLKSAGANIHDSGNVKYLPTKAGVDSNSNLAIHNGSHPKYTEAVKRDLDRVSRRAKNAKANGKEWTQSKYKAEVEKIKNKYNNLLDNGKIKCK